MKARGNSVLLTLASLTIAITGVISPRTISLVQKAPVLVSAFFPTYPPIARAAQIMGDVKIRVAIDAHGNVTETEILEGHKLLNDASVDAARQWRFETQESASEKRFADLTFRFTLMPRCSDKRNHTPIFHAPYTAEIRQEKPWLSCDDCSPERE